MTLPPEWLEAQARHRERVGREQASRRKKFAELMPVIDFWTQKAGAKVVFAQNSAGDTYGKGFIGHDDSVDAGELIECFRSDAISRSRKRKEAK